MSHPGVAMLKDSGLDPAVAELLEQLADRVRLTGVRNLATILAQSERVGTDATAVLLETSSTLRTTMRQRAMPRSTCICACKGPQMASVAIITPHASATWRRPSVKASRPAAKTTKASPESASIGTNTGWI